MYLPTCLSVYHLGLHVGVIQDIDFGLIHLEILLFVKNPRSILTHYKSKAKKEKNRGIRKEMHRPNSNINITINH